MEQSIQRDNKIRKVAISCLNETDESTADETTPASEMNHEHLFHTSHFCDVNRQVKLGNLQTIVTSAFADFSHLGSQMYQTMEQSKPFLTNELSTLRSNWNVIKFYENSVITLKMKLGF